jgi:hypothetical protein
MITRRDLAAAAAALAAAGHRRHAWAQGLPSQQACCASPRSAS